VVWEMLTWFDKYLNHAVPMNSIRVRIGVPLTVAVFLMTGCGPLFPQIL